MYAHGQPSCSSDQIFGDEEPVENVVLLKTSETQVGKIVFDGRMSRAVIRWPVSLATEVKGVHTGAATDNTDSIYYEFLHTPTSDSK